MGVFAEGTTPELSESPAELSDAGGVLDFDFDFDFQLS